MLKMLPNDPDQFNFQIVPALILIQASINILQYLRSDTFQKLNAVLTIKWLLLLYTVYVIVSLVLKLTH